MLNFMQNLALEMGWNVLPQPSRVDDQVGKSTQSQRLHMPIDQCFAAHLEQRLWQHVGQWPHALAASGGQNQGWGSHIRLIMAAFMCQICL